MMLSDQDRELLSTLTRRVRFFSEAQVARGYWPDSAGLAGRRLEQLVEVGLVELYRAMVHPELQLSAPVTTWGPGDPEPDMDRASYQLRSRWGRPLQPTRLCRITTKGARLFGGRGGALKRPLQVTHDLHVATMYLALVTRDPTVPKRWRGEDVLPRAEEPGAKHPDALLLGENGSPDRVIEFGGSYDGKRVRKLHEWCARKALAYELW